MSGTVIAESSRIILREFHREDLPNLRLLLTDPEVMRFSVTGPLSAAKVEAFLERCQQKYQEQGYWLWAAVLRAENVFIGYSGLLDQTIEGNPEIEVAYRLLPIYWGRGLGTEAAALARDYAFTKLKVGRIISLIEPANVASIRVAEKNGLRFEKDTTYYHLHVRVYALSREEWLRLPHVILSEEALDSPHGENVRPK